MDDGAESIRATRDGTRMLSGRSEMECMNVETGFVEAGRLETDSAGGELTQTQQDAIAERIAAVLVERKRVGEERRRRERENWLRSSRRAQERYRLRMQVGEVA
jgi:hypothetical protein